MRRALAVLVLAAAAAAGCTDQGPVSGDLSVRLATSRLGIRAILFRAIGPQHGVTAGSGSAFRVIWDQSGDTAWIAVIAPQPGGLAAGEIARLSVPDTRNAAAYQIALTDIAAADYSVGDISGITLTVVKP